jgi:hypothetical protein
MKMKSRDSMNEINIADVKGIKDKIDYIRIKDKIYTKMSYAEVLEKLIKDNIDSDKATVLEDNRVIRFRGNQTSNSKVYRDYVYVVPRRKDDQINKIIKILNVTRGNTKSVSVKFKGAAVDVIEKAEERREILNELAKNRKKQEQRDWLMKYFPVDIEDDETTMHEILETADDYEDYLHKIEIRRQCKLERMRENLDYYMNDVKQAEKYNVSIDVYRERYKENNLHSDKIVGAYVDYLRSGKNDDDMLLDFGD